MNQINFLPESYFRECKRKRRVYGEYVLVAVVVILLGAMGVASSRNVAQLTESHQAIVRDTEMLLAQVNQKMRLTEERKALIHEVKLQRKLTVPLKHTAVIDALGGVMPSSMAISHFTMATESPELKLPASKAPSRRKRRRSKRAPTQEVAKVRLPHEVMRVELVGLCSSDIEIANFIGTLAQHALFNNVKMLFSRSTIVNGHIAREFRIDMEVFLDREYLPLEQDTQEVASAH